MAIFGIYVRFLGYRIIVRQLGFDSLMLGKNDPNKISQMVVVSKFVFIDLSHVVESVKIITLNKSK